MTTLQQKIATKQTFIDESHFTIERSMEDQETLDVLFKGDIIMWVEDLNNVFMLHTESNSISIELGKAVISLCEEFVYNEIVAEENEKAYDDYYSAKNSERIHIYA